MKNYKMYTMLLILTLLSACSEPYEGTFSGTEPGGKEFKIKITDSQFRLGEDVVNYKLAETKDLNDGTAYVFQLFDPENKEEALENLVVTMQMTNSDTMRYGVSHYGLIVTGEFNTMELKRE